MKDFKNKTLYTVVQSGNRVELFIKKSQQGQPCCDKYRVCLCNEIALSFRTHTQDQYRCLRFCIYMLSLRIFFRLA